jgi:hypothetical protein
MLRKLITAAALALGLTGAAVAPAEAGGFHGGGGGGFHGGGFHGGGFHGGGFHGGFGGFHGGFRGGFANRGFAFRHDHFRRGFFPFFGAGAGLAYAGAYPYYDDYDYPYGDYSGYCYLHRQWVWNGYRHVYALVRVCP